MEYWHKKEQDLLGEIHKLSPAKGRVLFWYIGQMGCVIKTSDLLLAIDPVLNDLTRPDGTSRRLYPPPFTPEELTGLDYILCTHNHADHLNPATCIPLLKENPNAKLIIPAPVACALDSWGQDAQPLLHGRIVLAHAEEALALSPLSQVVPVPAAHEEYHQDANGNYRELGWLLHLGDTTLYHSGDTVVTEELVARLHAEKRIDLACLPINGVDFERHRAGIVGNMGCRDAAWLADNIAAELTIPMHYDMVAGNTEEPLIFAYYMRKLYPSRRYKIMALGECAEIAAG